MNKGLTDSQPYGIIDLSKEKRGDNKMKIKKVVNVSIKLTTDDYKVLENALDLLNEMDEFYINLSGDEIISDDIANILDDVSNVNYLLDKIISNLKKIGWQNVNPMI